MEVKPGYKHTEVGVIPEGWDVQMLGNIASIAAGGTPSRRVPEYWDGGIPWVTTTEIDFNTVFETHQTISPLGLQNSAAKLLNPGTLLLALYGQGKTRGKVARLGIRATTNQACASIVLSDLVSNSFIFHYLVSRYEVVRGLSNSGSQENLSGSIVKAIPIPIPPTLAEQETIAEALSDADALIESQEQLLAKKRLIKQGALQELLTGKRRLPGFSGEWGLRRLGDHVRFLRNGANSRAELLPEGRVKYLHYGDVHACAVVTLSPASLPSLSDAKAVSLDRLQDGDLIFVDASEDLPGVSKSVEMIGIGSTEVVSGLHTIAARFDKHVLADGFKGYLQFFPSFSTHLRRLAAGTKVYATNQAHIAAVEMRLPSVEEQTAIAAVLGDMDAEISALETKLSKARQIKQGMMQELLTGRIRLV